MNKKKFLELIGKKMDARKELEDKRTELRTKSDASEDIAEVRSITTDLKGLGKQIEDIDADVADLRAAVADIEAEERKNNPRGDLNPIATFGDAQNGEERQNNQPGQSQLEKRAAKFVETKAASMQVNEVRALLATGSTIARPKGVAKDVKESFNIVSSIVDMVAIEDCTGMGEYQVPYVKAEATATTSKEGTDANESETTFDYAVIKPTLVTTYCEVSRDFAKLSPANYLDKVQKYALDALRKKVGELIVKGNPSATIPELTGIVNASAIDTKGVVEITAIDEKTLRKVAMSYGGDENVVGNAVLLLNKADLIAFGDVRGSDKKPVYEITPNGTNPNTGIIKDGGLSVQYIINSNLTALSTATQGTTAIDTMLYGQPLNYQVGMFGNFEIRTDESVAFKRRMIAVLGEVQVGGNVVVKNGFIKVQLPKNS